MWCATRPPSLSRRPLQLCREIPTRYERGDEGEPDSEAFQEGIQPDPSDGLDLFEVPNDETPVQQHAETLKEPEAEPQDDAAGTSPSLDAVQEGPAVEKRVNKRLSFSSANPSRPLRASPNEVS